METNFRSILKAISWRITATLVTFLVSWVITGVFTIAVTIALAEVFAKLGLYWLHERAWNRMAWGRYKASLPRL